MIYRNCLKRVLDFTVSLIGIIIISPFIAIFILLLTISNKGSAFFFQKRPGKSSRIFSLVKFKTMNNNRNADGNLLPDAERLTRIGKFIRSYSLDELPQLVNVIKGDMSLIGPRPLLTKYLDRYTPEQARRQEIRPGITGWAQVNGRNAISWEEKFKLDVWYIDNVSFQLDCRILWMTIIKVIRRKGINAAQNITMKEFKGNKT